MLSPSLDSTPPATSHETLFVSGSDLFALGHYPGNPVYPGALMLERMLTMTVSLASEALGHRVRATAVKRVQYLGVVVPGDVVMLNVSAQDRNDATLTFEAVASVGNSERVRATILCEPDTEDSVMQIATAPAPPETPALTHREIGQLLPHRYPFLLLDTIHTFRPNEHIVATKVVNQESPILGRRPPDSYPASLAIESFGQAGVALFYLSQPDGVPSHALVGIMRDVALHRPIPYNTVLTLDVRIDRLRSNMVVFGGNILINNEPVIEVGSLVVMIAPQ